MCSGDAALLRAAVAGDAAAWSTIVERHHGMLWAIARGYRLCAADAGDVVQVAWLRLIENADRIADPNALPGWLATTVRRECLRLLRQARRTRVGVDTDVLDVEAVDAQPVDTQMLTHERDDALRRALHALPARDRQLLCMLSASPPASYATIARTLGMPIGSIGPTRRRALDMLRNHAATRELATC